MVALPSWCVRTDRFDFGISPVVGLFSQVMRRILHGLEDLGIRIWRVRIWMTCLRVCLARKTTKQRNRGRMSSCYFCNRYAYYSEG